MNIKLILIPIFLVISSFVIFIMYNEQKKKSLRNNNDDTNQRVTDDTANNNTQTQVDSCQSDVGKFNYFIDVEKNVLTTTKLNLRESPTVNSRVVKLLNKKEPLILRNEGDHWGFVETESGAKGFVCKKYIIPYGKKAGTALSDLDINRIGRDFNWHIF